MSDTVMQEVDRTAREMAKAALWKWAWEKHASLPYSRYSLKAKRKLYLANRRYKRALAACRRAEQAAMIEATA